MMRYDAYSAPQAARCSACGHLLEDPEPIELLTRQEKIIWELLKKYEGEIVPFNEFIRGGIASMASLRAMVTHIRRKMGTARVFGLYGKGYVLNPSGDMTKRPRPY